MSELTKLTKILTSVVREVVREELSFMKKDLLNEMKSLPVGTNMQSIREDYSATNNIPKLFNHFTPQSEQRNVVNEQQNQQPPKKLQMSLLQQLANQKMANPDDEFMAMKINHG